MSIASSRSPRSRRCCSIVAIIAAAVFVAPHVDPPILALAIGVFVGGVAQLVFQLRPLAKLGMLPSFRLDWRDEGVRRVLRAMGPAVLGVSAAQISTLINTQLAAYLGDGRISWITYADRLMEFPSALLGVALATILLPSLSKHHHDANDAQYRELLDWGLRLTFLLALPAALALALLAVPLISTLYQYGRFTAVDVWQTRAALLGYSVGLLGPDRGEDPGAGLLCAARHADAGSHRVRHAAGVANDGGDPDVPDRPRRADAVDFARRVSERGAALPRDAAARHLPAAARLGPLPLARRSSRCACWAPCCGGRPGTTLSGWRRGCGRRSGGWE